VETTFARSVELIERLGIPSEYILLILSALFLTAVIGLAVYGIVTTPFRVNRRVADLMRHVRVAEQQLNESEKVGHFGTFAWDFSNESASVWSEEMFRLCGLVPRTKPPSPAALLEHADKGDLPRTRLAWARAQNKPGPFEFTFLVVRPSGERQHIRIKGSTTLGADKRPLRIRGVGHDISKEIEVDRAKSEFVSLASHQLKTPLTTIKWYSEGLLKGSVGELAPEQRTYVESMHIASVRMMNMVNDLLDMSRIEMGKFATKQTDVDMHALAKSVIDEQMPGAVQKQLQLSLKCEEKLPHLQADYNLARMIIQNLISNSIKYTPKGGSVECELTHVGASRDSVLIRVSDTGIGIPTAEQGRVFEKLHRASNAEALVPDGTGLGLYVIKMIADQAGGGITFESKEGKGTTFYVSLPILWKNLTPEGQSGPNDHAILSS